MSVATEAKTVPTGMPDIKLSVRQTFGIDSDLEVPAFGSSSDYVPELDESYRFDRDTTLAILAGFAFNRRVMIQGYHGTGKSTHIEQVAARLNWPCVRVNLDGHISRLDLVGRDAIVLREAVATHAPGFSKTEDRHEYGYKELIIPATASGDYPIEKHALHIWPRKSHMMIEIGRAHV